MSFVYAVGMTRGWGMAGNMVTTLVVDKTGTLTEGKPKLVDTLPIGGFDAKELLRLAASLEQNSEHPLVASSSRARSQK